jgi:hypothetical protein
MLIPEIVSGNCARLVTCPVLDTKNTKNAHADKDYQVIASKSGADSLRYRDKWLLSAYDPEREAEKAADAVIPVAAGKDPVPEICSADCIVFLGSGLGYFIKTVLERVAQRITADSRPLVLIIDESMDVFRHSLGQKDFGILERFEVHGFTDLDSVSRVGVPGRFMLLTPGPAFRELEFYKKAADRVRILAIDGMTRARFAGMVLKNSLRNISGLEGIRVLRPLPAGAGTERMTGVIAGAGPSLDTLIPVLLENRKKYFLVSSDTAFAPLLRAGVEPDLVFSGDPQYVSCKHFLPVRDRIPACKTMLVADVSIHPVIRSLFPERTILVDTGSPLAVLVSGRTGAMNVRMGGSVTAGIFDILSGLGFGRILFAGQDFTMKFDRTHCRDTLYDRVFMQMNTRTRTMNSIRAGLHYPGSFRPDPARPQLYTTLLLASYCTWLLDAADRTKSQVLNLSPDSLLLSEKIRPGGPEVFLKTGRGPDPDSFLDTAAPVAVQDPGLADAAGKIRSDAGLALRTVKSGLAGISKQDGFSVNGLPDSFKAVFEWVYAGKIRYADQAKFGKRRYREMLLDMLKVCRALT